MESINDRYLMNRIRHSDLFGTLCSVSDTLRYNNQLELHLLANTAETSELIAHLKDNFIRISQLFHPNIRRFRHFARVQRIDELPVATERYLLTSDEPRGSYRLDEIREDLKFEDIIRIISELASALQYLHDRQFCFGSLSAETVLFHRRDEVWHVQYIGLPLQESLTKCIYHHGHSSFARILHSDAKMGPIQNDLASLGLFLFSLLAKSPIMLRDFGSVFELTYKRFVDHEDLQKERKCMSMISRLIRLDIQPEDQMEPTDIIRAFNEQFGQKFPLYAHTANNRILSRIPIIDSTNQFHTIIFQGISHLKTTKALRLQILRGSTGTGKTRILEEVQFFAEMAAMSVFTVGMDTLQTGNPCLEIARNMLSHPDPELIHKYGSELIKIFPGMASLTGIKASPLLDVQQEEARLKSRLMSFVSDAIKKRPTVILLDNVHTFSTENMVVLDQLLQRVKSRACWFFLAMSSERPSQQDAYIEKWEEIYGCNQYELNNLSPEDASQFVVSVMGLRRKAKLFSDHIYRETDGNPGLMHKTIFVLVQEKLLYLDPVGRWSTNYDALHDYRQLKTTSSYEQSLLEGVRNMSGEKKQILQVLATMLNPVPLHVISEMLHAEPHFISEILGELVDSQLIAQQANDAGYTYGIKYGAQKALLLQDASEENIQLRHKEAVRVISALLSENTYELMDELIYQSEYAGENRRVVSLCSDASEKMIRSGAMQQALNYLDTGLRISRDTHDQEGLGKLLYKKAGICSSSGLYDDALLLLREARDVFQSIGAMEDHLHAGFDLFHACMQGDRFAEAERFLTEIERDAIATPIANAECKILLCKSQTAQASGNLEYALDLVLLAFEVYLPDSDQMLLGKLHEAAGTYNGALYRFESAMHHHKSAVSIYESLGAQMKLAEANQAIGTIYANIQMDSVHARVYFDKSLKIAKDHQMSNVIAHSLNNIGDTYALEDRFREAIPFFEQSIDVAEENRFINILIYPLMNLVECWTRIGDFKSAYLHLKRAEAVIRSNEVSSLTIAYLALYAMHYYYFVGDTERSAREAQKVQDVLKNSPDASEAEVYTALCHTFPKEPHAFDFRQFEAEINLMEASRRKRDLWILLAQKALQAGKKTDVKYFLSCIGRTTSISPMQQLQVTLLRTLLHAEPARLLRLERFINQLPNDAMYLRGFCAGELFRLHLASGNERAALQYGIHALNAVRLQLDHVPDEHVQTFLAKQGAVQLYQSISHLHATLTEFPVDPFSVESLSDMPGLSMRSIWKNAVAVYHENSLITDKEMLKVFEAELQSEEPVNALISSIAHYIQADWWMLAQTTAEGSFNIFEKSTNLSSECAQLLADEYIPRTGPFCDLNLSATDDFHTALPNDTTAILGMTIFPEHNMGSTVHPNRRKPTQHTFRKGVILFGTTQIFHTFSDDAANVLKSLEQLLSLLLENHILKSVSNIDRLTGLFSRKYMEDALNSCFAVAREIQEPLSILMLDLDRFKVVNDKFGHQKGDDVLHTVSSLVMKNCRKQDICCRYGGEELLVLLPDTGTKQARVIAERIRRNIECTEMLENHPITVSIGVSSYPVHGEFQDDVILHADLALYRAKQTGRNKTVVFSKSMRKSIRRNDKIETTDLYLLLQNERILHNYNAIFTFMTRNMEHHERIQAVLDRLSNVIPADHIIFIDAASNFRHSLPDMICLHQNHEQEGNLDAIISLPLIRTALRAKAIRTSVEWGKMREDQLQEVSRMAVPVMCRDEIRGVLYFHSAVSSYEYERKDQNIATLFSNLIGLGLPSRPSSNRATGKKITRLK